MQIISWTVLVLATAWSAVWPMWAVAAFAFLLIVAFRRTLRRRKIQARNVTVRQLRTELWFSFLTLSFGSLIGVTIEWLSAHGLASVPTGPLSSSSMPISIFYIERCTRAPCTGPTRFITDRWRRIR
jgi:phosphatidylglycerophosphate synthase